MSKWYGYHPLHTALSLIYATYFQFNKSVIKIHLCYLRNLYKFRVVKPIITSLSKIALITPIHKRKIEN